MANILIFGGSFDPPHIGHMAAISSAYEACENAIDKVWIMPCAQERAGKPPHAGSMDRLCMCEHMADALNDWHNAEIFDISSIEVDLKCKYTIDLVEHLPEGNRYFLFLGPDYTDPGGQIREWDNVMKYVIPLRLEHDDSGINVRSTTIRERLASGMPISFMTTVEIKNYIESKKLYGGK